VSFDVLAPHYTWMERLLAGPRLQRCRTQWLDQLAGCERILIAGVGRGHFLKACARRLPNAKFVSVDASAGMLLRAKANVPDDPQRFEFIHASLPQWRPPAGSFDAIVTHFFFDCFPPEELASVVAGLADAARPRAQWLVGDFAVPPQGWRSIRARAIHTAMYAFFRPVTGVKARRVTAPDSLLSAQRFRLIQRQTSEWGLLHSDCWSRP
jgi:ubiquinone/menaquinone biosynthesis C-methylase UbiE